MEYWKQFLKMQSENRTGVDCKLYLYGVMNGGVSEMKCQIHW